MTKPKEMADDVLGPEIAAERLEELEAKKTLTVAEAEERQRLYLDLEVQEVKGLQAQLRAAEEAEREKVGESYVPPRKRVEELEGRVVELEAMLAEACRERDEARGQSQAIAPVEPKAIAEEVARILVTDDTVMTAALAHRGEDLALEPDTVVGLHRYARSIVGSPLLHDEIRGNVQGILHMLLRGRDLGLTPTASLSLYVMKTAGQLKIEVPAQVIAAKVLEHPECLYLELRESTRERATWATKRRRRDGTAPEEELLFSFDVQDAVAANYIEVKGEEPVVGADGEERLEPIYGAVVRAGKDWKTANWTTQIRTMLRWRALTELARAIYPESTFDMYDRSEIPEPVDVTPPKAEEGSASSGRRVDGLKDRIRRRAEELDDAELVEGDSDHG